MRQRVSDAYCKGDLFKAMQIVTLARLTVRSENLDSQLDLSGLHTMAIPETKYKPPSPVSPHTSRLPINKPTSATSLSRQSTRASCSSSVLYRPASHSRTPSCSSRQRTSSHTSPAAAVRLPPEPSYSTSAPCSQSSSSAGQQAWLSGRWPRIRRRCSKRYLVIMVRVKNRYLVVNFLYHG